MFAAIAQTLGPAQVTALLRGRPLHLADPAAPMSVALRAAWPGLFSAAVAKMQVNYTGDPVASLTRALGRLPTPDEVVRAQAERERFAKRCAALADLPRT